MEFLPFHRSGLSLPIIRRRVAEEVVDLAACFGAFMRTRGRSLLWNHCYPSTAACDLARYRLERRGFIVRQEEGGPRVIELTESGEGLVSPLCRKRASWPKKWNQHWYLLFYDVPEAKRRLRNVLRRFLKRLRMGCLQKSVWISARDVRPEFYDLSKGISVDLYSYLFESRTVFGQTNAKLAGDAWDFERLGTTQSFFVEVYSENLRRLQAAPPLSSECLFDLARAELSAYLSAMREDPFLPRELWPPGYQGEAVWLLHERFQDLIRSRL